MVREDLVEGLLGLGEDDLVAVIQQALVRKRGERRSGANPPMAGGWATVGDLAAFETLLSLLADADKKVVALAGGPRALHDSVQDAYVDLAIRGQAHRAVLDVDMLTSAAVAEALGLRGKNPREVASRLRRSGALLGVPDTATRGYIYPAFQIDPIRRRIHPVVKIVNTATGAASDPWGVASWWVTPHGALAPGRAPMDLVGTEIEDDLLVMVGVLPETAASDAGGVADLLAPFTASRA